MDNAMRLCLLVLVAGSISVASLTPEWPHPYWDIPGAYCRAKYPEGRCCLGRDDPCNVPILGTLCYCDTFCNRTENSDCCPDYFTHCEGLSDYQYYEQRPEELIKPEDVECSQGVRGTTEKDSRCFYDGNFYSVRDTVKRNCNQCRCQVSLRNPNCMEFLCETETCLTDQQLHQSLEEAHLKQEISWRPKNHSQFWGYTLQDGIRNRLGTIWPLQGKDMIPMKFRYNENDLPEHFDARQKWGDAIHDILDQGWCGASWAFSTISVAADRLAIDTHGEENFSLSPQTLLSCNTRGQMGCSGGYIDRAWSFLRKYGTVPEECYPYEASQTSCRFPLVGSHIQFGKNFTQRHEIFRSCSALRNRHELFKMQPSYRVGRPSRARHPRRTEHDIMFEIMTHGPVQAIMDVSRDFFLYSSGVYHKLAESSPVEGQHSVKILGWGSEAGTRYWLAANSWGKDWGEQGYFKILRGSNECNIEARVVGVWAQAEEMVEKMKTDRHRRKRWHSTQDSDTH